MSELGINMIPSIRSTIEIKEHHSPSSKMMISEEDAGAEPPFGLD
jgi:hypothetical protein